MKHADKPYRFRACAGRAISVEFRFMPGKRISTGCYDMPSAALWAEEYLKNQGMTDDKPPAFSEFARDFFTRRDPDSIYSRNEAFGRKFSKSYYKQRQAILDTYIIPAFGSYIVDAISSVAIERFMVTIKRKGGGVLANETKNRILTVMRVVMDDVKRKGYRSDNPADDVQMFAKVRNPRSPLPGYELAILFPENLDERVEIWGGLMWAVYFSIFYDTGMRPGEIAALRVCDVYRTQKGLAIASAKSMDSVEKDIKDKVKTSGKGLENRVGLLYDDTAVLLLRYIDESGLSGDDLLFRSNRGNPIITATSNKHFKTVLEKHGLYREGKVQYSLRHSYETDRRGDMPDSILAVSMGHTKLRDDYDHRTEKDMIRLLDRNRDSFFENRGRRDADADVVPLDGAKKKREPV